jgi:SAM-dependent MidA family methyltransferase
MPAAPPAILEALRRRAGGADAVGFADFVDVALYEPGCGYYRRAARRIGRTPGTDFYTADSSPLFARLVVEACAQLLGPEAPSAFDFVEVGAEPDGGVLRGVEHPFRSARAVCLGEPLRLDGPCVVFSNELFDAQPFRRMRYRGGSWRELGVSFGDGALAEVELGLVRQPVPALPARAAEGYVIDAPLASAELAGRIAELPWRGLFLAFDYGKPWEEIASALPAGSARAYSRHTQANDLLASPGEQDLTCHVCWDWISDALKRHGFAEPVVESQEAFLVRHCSGYMAQVAARGAAQLDRDKLSLMQLLHPGNMGQKFQVLRALRRSSPAGQRKEAQVREKN